MKIHWKKLAIPVAVLMLGLCLSLPSLAEEGSFEYSNQIAVEDEADLITEAEEIEGGETPEGAIRVRAEFLPDDTAAPEEATVILLYTNATSQKVVLTREGGWQKTVKPTEGLTVLSYTLLGFESQSMAVDGQTVTFTVPLAKEMELVDETGEGETAGAARSILIAANVTMEQELFFGDTIVLTGTLTGYEDLTYTLSWQVNKGNGFEPIEGADGLTYSFILSEENLVWEYRLEAAVSE